MNIRWRKLPIKDFASDGIVMASVNEVFAASPVAIGIVGEAVLLDGAVFRAVGFKIGEGALGAVVVFVVLVF